jgi:hypothetical protein
MALADRRLRGEISDVFDFQKNMPEKSFSRKKIPLSSEVEQGDFF